ncbi:MAG: acyl carrier protein [Clostridiales bacterium]|nr:acyl carrier protein [Clostridiales bacterium]
MTIDKVKKLISNQLNVAEAKITENSRLIEDLGADSLDTVEMLMAFEEEFGISIPDEEAMNMKTVKDIVTLIDSKNK